MGGSRGGDGEGEGDGRAAEAGSVVVTSESIHHTYLIYLICISVSVYV